MSINKVIVLGNLTRDAETRQVGDKTVVSFSIATSEKYTGRDGQAHEETEFHNCEYWCNGNIAQYLKKGTQVYAEGSIKTDSYQGQDGQQRQTKKIRVREVQLLGSRQQNAQPQAPSMPTPPMPQGQPYYPPQPQQRQAYPPQPQYQQPTAPQYQPPYQPQGGYTDDLPM